MSPLNSDFPHWVQCLRHHRPLHKHRKQRESQSKISHHLTVSCVFRTVCLSSFCQRSSGSFIRKEIKSSSAAAKCREYFVLRREEIKRKGGKIHPLQQRKSFNFLLSLASLWCCRQLETEKLLLRKQVSKRFRICSNIHAFPATSRIKSRIHTMSCV